MHSVERVDDALARRLTRDAGFDLPQLLDDLVANGDRRVERNGRVGADIADLPPAQLRHLVFVKTEEIASLVEDLAGGDAQRQLDPVDQRVR